MALLRTIWDKLVAVVKWCWRCGHVIWVCRVAVAGVAAGGYLLAYTEQARDLFADLSVTPMEWGVFLILVFCWALIVHAEGRRALQHDDWVPESQAGGLSDKCPGGLSYDCRRALQKSYFYPALWLPGLLGFLVFFSVGFAIFRTYLNLSPAAPGLPEAARAVTLALYLLAFTFLEALVYICLYWKPWVFRWKRWSYRVWIKETPTGESLEPEQWSRKPPLLAGTAPLLASKLPGYTRPTTPEVPLEGLDKFLGFVSFVTFLLLLVTIYYPHYFAELLPRLFVIPVLFGGSVVVLGEVTAWSMRLRTPLLLAIVAIGLGLVYFTERFHDARWIEATVEPSKAAGDKRQISFADAVERWKAANKCAGSDASRCPRPILIAGAGGASRAGFFTATVVGALIDLGLDDKRGAPYGNIRSRIFALSTVSGSSAGAAVMRAALLDAAARNDPNTPPCKTGGTGSWFGQPMMTTDKTFDPKKNWRDCFQAILAGDFLSPIFVALATRDNFPLPFNNPMTGRPYWPDRAVLLEQAFERRYHRFTTEGGNSESCPDQPPKAGSDGLCRPFGYHPDPTAAGAWVPIFFINGMSVFSGRRIVVGDVATTNSYRPNATFMPLAYDINDVRIRKTKEQENKQAVEKGTDIRLSTAATMSARFPVISPQGLLRTLHGDVTDQIVDGGYFENDGLATISDVARALKDGFKLDPVVIRIVNEPSKPKDAAAEKTRPPEPTAKQRSERSLFDDFLAVARALVASRSGHEDDNAASLKSVLARETRLYEIGVYEFAPPESDAPAAQRSMSPQTNPVCRREVKSGAKMENVSMSWWMSQPVQAYLDAQLCLPANWERLECELREGRTNSGGECP